MNQNERYSRQQDLVPAERLSSCKISIVGVGAIGRQVVLQLAAMGAANLQLIDFDVVEESNLASQGYLEEDLGEQKVQATAEMCRQINSKLEIQPLNERFRRSMDMGNVLFCAVDKIDTRRLIWEAVKDKVSFFGDTRMSAEVIRVLTVADAKGREHYPSTLFAAQEAFAGSCSAKSTVYSANVAAGMAIGQFAKWLRRLPVEADVTLNLLSSELSCGA